MEAACKAIIGGRLKRSGMFWTVRGANSIIALRCCRLSGKRRTRRLMPLVDALLDALQAPGASVLDEVLRNECSRVRSAVVSLPPEQRMVIVLRYTQGLSYDEIAAILGCSTGTVASRLNRVHKILERRLSRLAGARGGDRG